MNASTEIIHQRNYSRFFSEYFLQKQNKITLKFDTFTTAVISCSEMYRDKRCSFNDFDNGNVSFYQYIVPVCVVNLSFYNVTFDWGFFLLIHRKRDNTILKFHSFLFIFISTNCVKNEISYYNS